MDNSYILCSIKEDLYSIDKANLRMNGIKVTDQLTEAIQPMLENEASCLLLTDKLIEEQSSLIEITKQVKILFDIYPKKIKIIYIKRGGDSDSLVKLMDDNSNWDVYYNSELSQIPTEDLIDRFLTRKMPVKNQGKGFNQDVKIKMIQRANALTEKLITELREIKDFDNNTGFKSLILKNMTIVRDLVLSYETLKDDLKKHKEEINGSHIIITKYAEDIKDMKITNNNLEDSVKDLETNRRVMQETLRELHSAYNVLVDNLQEVANVGDVHTSLSKTIDADKYYYKSPLIVYFKERTSLNYFTTFITKFNALVTNTIGLSKVLVIENDLKTGNIPLYEAKDYVYVDDGTQMDKIVLGNLVCCGNNTKLINYLIQNSLQLDLLLIYDRTGANFDLLEGQNVIKFEMAKTLTDAKVLKTDITNLITNDPRGEYQLRFSEEYRRREGNEELELSIISTFDLTKKLITYLNEWNRINVDRNNEFSDEVELNDEVDLTETIIMDDKNI